MISIEDLSQTIFRILRKMDEEASHWYFEDGYEYPSGLRMFGQHVKPNRDQKSSGSLRQYHNEDTLVAHLAGALNRVDGITETSLKPCYPDSSKKGDLLLRFADNKKLFMEVKPAYPYNWCPNAKPTKNKSYKAYLPSLSRSHSAAKDILKLNQLSGRFVGYAGVLLIGFDIEAEFEISDSDITELKSAANYNNHMWNEAFDCWSDTHQQDFARQNGRDFNCRTRCWFWLRKIRMGSDASY